jgi:hypothetical protein
MLQAGDFAGQRRGLAVWFPSPSEYEAKAFLASLSEVTAQRYIDHYVGLVEGLGTETEVRRLKTRRQSITFALLLLTMLSAFIGASQFLQGTISARTSTLIRVIANPFIWFAVIFYISILVVPRLVRPPNKSPEERLYDRAVEIRQQARFTSAQKETGDRSFGASVQGITAAFKRSSELSLAEHESTISSLIHEYREFVRRVAKQMTGPVVVGIDELDKMHDAEDVATLLRDTKGIFDVEGVHYFVSISDEAARSITMGGLKVRNEFNSSFYQVFKAPPLDEGKCKTLLARRGIVMRDRQDLIAICVLSGGLPREVVRLADILLGSERDHAESAAWLIMRDESLALREYVERLADDGHLGEKDEMRVLEVTESLERSYRILDCSALQRFWSPIEDSIDWQNHMKGQWRRFMLRYEVGRALEGQHVKESTTDRLVAEMQEVVRRSEGSPAAGRRLMKGFSSRATTQPSPLQGD